MEIRETILHNGVFFKEDNFTIRRQNRAFKFGDFVFETLYVSKGCIHFFYEHIARLVLALKTFEIEVPPIFEVDTMRIYNDILTLLVKNRLYGGARVRISAYRTSGGLYTPKSNIAEYIIEATALENTIYTLNQKGLQIGVFSKHLKPITDFSGFKSGNSILFILAGIHATKYKLDDCLIINQFNRIIETVSSNIFIVKNNCILTPPTSEGCVAGIMRAQIIKLSHTNKIEIVEQPFSVNDVLNADEVFTTNSISGVRWVMSFNNKRYFNKYSKMFIKLLNTVIHTP